MIGQGKMVSTFPRGAGGAAAPRRYCAADHGAAAGSAVCCGQKGVVASEEHACGEAAPKCSGYVAGSAWGACVKNGTQAWPRHPAAAGYEYPNRWHGYVPPLARELLEARAAADGRCEGIDSTLFLYADLTLNLPGIVSHHAFRMHQSEHFSSRLLDFVIEAAEYRLFWGGSFSRQVASSLASACMTTAAGTSTAGRVGPVWPE